MGVAIIKTSASFIGSNPCVFTIPVVFLFIILAWVIIWAFIAAYVYSVGEIKQRSDVEFMSDITWDKTTRYMWYYHLFALLWLNAFFIGCAQFIIASACATWYFSFSGDTKGKGSLCLGIRWILRYHIGSIAFGSCIIAIVQFIRLMFEYYRKKIQKASKNNPIVKALLCLTGYLLWYLEKCVKFISKNAYIQIVLASKNFCASALNAFLLVIKNAARFGVVNSIGCIFMFIGKLFVMVTCGLLTWVILSQIDYFDKQLTGFPVAPVLCAVVLGYFIGSVFMSVFSFSADTVLQCFLLDEELNDQGKSRPAGNRPPELDTFIDDVNKKSKGCCC